ncbi:MAG: energy transducer TonB [Deltaproteobacteria bacterium]|nr:energy transducer TonB [Deltaproteobacteria bacterium]
MGIRVTRGRGLNWMLASLICLSVAIHALILWRFADDFHPRGTGAVTVVLAPGLSGDSVAVPRPPAPLASDDPAVKEKVVQKHVPPETDPDMPQDREQRIPAAPGAFPPQAQVVKWKGGAAKSAAGHKASAEKVSNASDISGGAADLKNTYLAGVRQKIAKMRQYPVSARMRHLEGRVFVRFFIRADGRAEDIKIVSGSRVASLDNAALDAVISASPFPPLPKGLPEKGLIVNVPIKFEITNR